MCRSGRDDSAQSVNWSLSAPDGGNFSACKDGICLARCPARLTSITAVSNYLLQPFARGSRGSFAYRSGIALRPDEAVGLVDAWAPRGMRSVWSSRRCLVRCCRGRARRSRVRGRIVTRWAVHTLCTRSPLPRTHRRPRNRRAQPKRQTQQSEMNTVDDWEAVVVMIPK